VFVAMVGMPPRYPRFVCALTCDSTLSGADESSAARVRP
jgi:hypothetical protein